LYLTSFDAQRIRVNKKVKEYYESLLIYNETREIPEEDYEPIVAIAEPITQPITITKPASVVVNKFIDYQYVEDRVELSEEKYESQNSDIKIITLG
jgi:hypothetical protein